MFVGRRAPGWLLPMAGFGLLSSLLFRRLLFQGRTLMDLDFPNIHVPFRTFTAAALGKGDLPLWAPVQFGLPYLAHGDTAVLYPFQLPFLLLEPVRAIGPVLWLQTVLTMATMYAFLRVSLQLSRPAASAGSVIFGLNGFFMVHLGLLGLVYAQPWVTLVLLGLERSIRGRPAWAIAGGAGIALSFLAGHPQQLFFSAPAILIFVAMLAMKQQRPHWGRIVAGCALVVVIGLGLAAVQILPQAELVANSHRSELSFEEATFGSVDQGRIWTILLPDFWRRASGEVAGWVGVVGLALAAVGAAACLRRGRIAEAACWLAITLAGLVLSVGGSTPLYSWLLNLWPGFDQFRFPLRFLYLAVLGVSVLAAYGFDVLRARAAEGYSRRAAAAALVSLAACAALAVAFGSAWEDRRLLAWASGAALLPAAAAAFAPRVLGRRGVEALLLIALAFELVAVASFLSWNHPSPRSAYEPGPVRAYLERNPGGRLASVPKDVLLFDSSRTLAAAMGNAALLTGTPSVESFGGQWPPERLTALQEGFADKLRSDDPEVIGRTSLFRLLAVEYVVGDQTQPNLARAAHLRPVAGENGLTLYRAREVGPRVRTYCGARFESDPRQIRDAVLGPGFDTGLLWIEGSGRDVEGGECGQTGKLSETPNRVEVEVSLPVPGWVFLADSWYPGWKAEVDGEPTVVEKAQGFFRAVRVPAGEHEVVFSFQPASFRTGTTISVLTLLAVAAGPLIARRNRRAGTEHK